MTSLENCIHALMGRGVSFCHESGYKLVINAGDSVLSQTDIETIQHNKPLLMLILPKNKIVTASQLANGLECYEERVSIMWNGGDGIEIERAKNLAIPCTLRFMQSL